MAMNTFEAKVKMSGGGYQKVTIQADNWSHAKQLLAAQYGAVNVYDVTQKS
jgi:hypothetical protein